MTSEEHSRRLSRQARNQLRDAQGRFCSEPVDAVGARRLSLARRPRAGERRAGSSRVDEKARSSARRATKATGSVDDVYYNLPKGYGGGYGDPRSGSRVNHGATDKDQQPGEHGKILIDLLSSSDEEFGRDEGGMTPDAGKGKGKVQVKGDDPARELHDKQLRRMSISELHDAVAESQDNIEQLHDELYKEKQRKKRIQRALTDAVALARRKKLACRAPTWLWLSTPSRRVTVVDGIREGQAVAAHMAVAVERRDSLNHERLEREAGAGERRRGRPHSLGGAEHAHGALHGSLQRRGAGHLLTGEVRRSLAQAQGVFHRRRLGGAWRDVERGEDIR